MIKALGIHQLQFADRKLAIQNGSGCTELMRGACAVSQFRRGHGVVPRVVLIRGVGSGAPVQRTCYFFYHLHSRAAPLPWQRCSRTDLVPRPAQMLMTSKTQVEVHALHEQEIIFLPL
ncbi:unnamed protein product [Leptosia nina]|uniref:Uncharacterized protein n=1 Tax=Leptosia nina TaxID=320188 RepID=A0AAV1JH25_9NEOP